MSNTKVSFDVLSKSFFFFLKDLWVQNALIVHVSIVWICLFVL